MRARYDIDTRKVRAAMTRAAEEAAQRGANAAREHVREGIISTDRIRSGRMLNGLRIRRAGAGRYRVVAPQFYAGYQEFGRGPVRPIRAKALRFKPKGTNYFVFAKYVRPDPGGHFFRRALARTNRRDFVK